MKLRNKKTGDICELNDFCLYNEKGFAIRPFLKSLTELNEEWEDVPEEPKELWSIDQFGEPINVSRLDASQLEKLRRIGNLFQTEEEAEKAVEKLKAWKRLKDNGFMFNGIISEGSDCLIKTKLKDNTGVSLDNAQQFYEDVESLFGGEE